MRHVHDLQPVIAHGFEGGDPLAHANYADLPAASWEWS